MVPSCCLQSRSGPIAAGVASAAHQSAVVGPRPTRSTSHACAGGAAGGPVVSPLVEILSWPETDVPRALRLQVVRIQNEAWPRDPPRTAEPQHDPAQRAVSMLLVEDGRVRAALDVLSKPMVHRGETYAASGLSMVVTDRAVHRQGYGKRLVEAAREAMRAGGVDLAIFTCDTPLAPLYESAGFCVLPGTVLVGGTPADPLPSDRLDKVTLACFFASRALAHAADFVNARIELHSGEIDRLW
jgi:aminoglycoside 2'-N-acetyltransferase I